LTQESDLLARRLEVDLVLGLRDGLILGEPYLILLTRPRYRKRGGDQRDDYAGAQPPALERPVLS
jgi:hypothetical protein